MIPPKPLSVLVVEDEPAAAAKLLAMLATHDDVTVAATASDGAAAVRLMDSLRPDVVLLDVALPGCSGLDVLERSRHRPFVVFTTAFDRHAVTAFELQAVDYLLKPFGPDRLDRALERTRLAVARGEAADAGERAAAARSEGVLRRLYVRRPSGILALEAADVERFEARDDYVAAHAPSGRYLLGVRMDDLERRLDPGTFLRIHRSHIVNLAMLRELRAADDKRAAVLLRSGALVVASRARTPVLRARLALEEALKK